MRRAVLCALRDKPQPCCRRLSPHPLHAFPLHHPPPRSATLVTAAALLLLVAPHGAQGFADLTIYLLKCGSGGTCAEAGLAALSPQYVGSVDFNSGVESFAVCNAGQENTQLDTSANIRAFTTGTNTITFDEALAGQQCSTASILSGGGCTGGTGIACASGNYCDASGTGTCKPLLGPGATCDTTLTFTNQIANVQCNDATFCNTLTAVCTTKLGPGSTCGTVNAVCALDCRGGYCCSSSTCTTKCDAAGACESCSAGSYWYAGAGRCITCSANEYSAGGAVEQCTKCATGYVRGGWGAEESALKGGGGAAQLG